MDLEDTLGSTHSEHEEHFLVEETELNPSECVETYLHPRQYIEQHETIPFSKVSSAWYERQYTLAMKNVGREKRQEESIKVLDNDGKLVCINKYQTQGTLQENMDTLSNAEVAENQRKHARALVAVAKYIIENGPVVKTQELGRIYIKEKELDESIRKRSMEFLVSTLICYRSISSIKRTSYQTPQISKAWS